MENSIGTIWTNSEFFLIYRFLKFGLQIVSFMSDHLRFMDSVGIGGF